MGKGKREKSHPKRSKQPLIKELSLKGCYKHMTKPRLSTGDVLFDEFLQGGYEIDVISTIFGPSGSGKTNLCLISLVATIKAGKKDIPILLTNQVYSSFDEQDKVNMVGGDILKYGSKCLLELEKLHSSKRRILIKKHRSLPEGRALVFDIVQEGMRTGETYEKPVQSSAPPPHE